MKSCNTKQYLSTSSLKKKKNLKVLSWPPYAFLKIIIKECRIWSLRSTGKFTSFISLENISKAYVSQLCTYLYYLNDTKLYLKISIHCIQVWCLIKNNFESCKITTIINLNDE